MKILEYFGFSNTWETLKSFAGSYFANFSAIASRQNLVYFLTGGLFVGSVVKVVFYLGIPDLSLVFPAVAIYSITIPSIVAILVRQRHDFIRNYH
jgi:hypothetical protein